MHDGGLDLRRWPEGARRYAERQSDVAIELGEHAEAAVRLASGRRGQALGHLALEHECHLADGPARAHQRHQDRLRHAIGQITQDDHPAAGRGHERPVVPRAGIGVDDLDGLEAPTQLSREPAIDLERDDAAGAPRELARQRALPRTDLEHEVVSRRRDEIDDAASDGGVAQEMLAESAAPVVHVSHGTTPRRAGIGVAKLLIGVGSDMFKKILVGTDFSEASDEARRVAIELARRLGAELEIVHVEEPLPAYAFAEGALLDLPRLQEEVRTWAERQLEDLARGARASGVSTTTAVLLGVPANTIVEAARTERADLIVVGTHGRTGLERVLLGSVAERVVRNAPCAVLTVRQTPDATQGAKP